MNSFKNNKHTAVLGLILVITFGCTATGQVDWAKLGGTILQVAALNYTGPLVETVDTIFTAFTGKEMQRPDQSQYPDSQYPAPAYPDQTAGDQGYPQEAGYADESWDSWGDPYPDPEERANPASTALSIDFAMLQTVPGGFAVMPDGARLRDGVGRSEAGDRFGIAFTTSEPAYVYIVNVDATGWAQTLFPYPDVPGYANPVAPGREVILPSEQLYGLDDARGVETVFVLVSRTPNRDLEAALEPLRGMERNASVGARGNQARVSVPSVGQRGLLGIVPGASQAQTVPLDRYFTEPMVGELAFSRWFNHE